MQYQEMKFKISPKFTGDVFHLSDPELFENPKINKKWAIKLPQIQNPFIDNEIRGYMQHMIIERKITPWSAQKLSNSLCRIEGLLNNPKYLNLDSVSDVSVREFTVDLQIYFDLKKLWKKNRKQDQTFLDPVCWCSWVYRTLRCDGKFHFEDDTWYLNEMPFEVDRGTNTAEAFYFSTFDAVWLKEAAKQVTLYKLKRFSVSTCKGFLDFLRVFDSFVFKYSIDSPKDLNRDSVEELLLPFARRNYPNPKTYNMFLRSIQQLMSTASMLEVDNFSKPNVFLKNDYMPKPSPDPHPYSEREISMIVEHISELEDIYFDAAAVLILQGFRVSDLLDATITAFDGSPALEQEENGDYTLLYYQYKVRRWTRTVLQEASGRIISERIRKSIDMYGPDCKYIFAVSAEKPATAETFRRKLRKMVKANDLRGDDGELLQIGNTHRFRMTVATDLAKMTHDPRLVAAVLGQKGFDSLLHYVKLSTTERREEMKILHRENDMLVASMGKEMPNILENSTMPDFEKDEKLIPLSCGYCCKPGTEICEHANTCLFCSMFAPDRSYLPVYRLQLTEAKIARESALMQGFDTISEHNEAVIAQLEKIIRKLGGTYV